MRGVVVQEVLVDMREADAAGQHLADADQRLPGDVAGLRDAGHQVVAVSAVSDDSRERAEVLLPGVPVLPVPEVVAAAQLVLLAVPDDALADLVAGLVAVVVVEVLELVDVDHQHRDRPAVPAGPPPFELGVLVEPPTVGDLLHDLMAERGWKGAARWREGANMIAPTLVGGSKKHGGPDLGPTRAKRAWAALGVDGMGIADAAPEETFFGMPRMTVRMTARVQGFPDTWQFAGRKTAAYRQIGNAFPAPVAKAVAANIHSALSARRIYRVA